MSNSAKSEMHHTKKQENRALNIYVNCGHKKYQSGPYLAIK